MALVGLGRASACASRRATDRPARAGPLIRLRTGDRPQQELDVVILSDERLGEFIEQFGMAGRVRRAEIIHWFNDADAEQMTPQPVYRGLGEVRVLRRGDPVGE